MNGSLEPRSQRHVLGAKSDWISDGDKYGQHKILRELGV
jgi:hypothetical protein